MDRPSHRHRSDPHRRPLRHTYQEGPGFLFLATRGGRPPGRPFGEDLAALRFRVLCVRTAQANGIAAALGLGVSRASLYRWRVRHAEGGIEALRDLPRGPARQHLPAWVEQAVIVVRLLTYWNSKRLAAEFTRREIWPLGHHAVDALLADLGTARPSVRREHGPAYERGRPNELWHIDIKGPFFLQRARGDYTKVWMVGLVDDHSRYLIGLRVVPRPSAAPILDWLAECVELCGVPIELMSDNGSPFVVWMPGVLTLFGKRLTDLRVRHLRTQVNSPWTNGKIERFWGLLQSEVLDREVFHTREAADAALARFSAYYNYHRLHGELDWRTPAERYERHPVQGPRLRPRPGVAPSPRLADRPHGRMRGRCLNFPGNYT
jgi:transposase InsO family protein